jgi:hypothetical protein
MDIQTDGQATDHYNGARRSRRGLRRPMLGGARCFIAALPALRMAIYPASFFFVFFFGFFGTCFSDEFS